MIGDITDDAQDTLPRTGVDVTFVLDIRYSELIHKISADIVLPEIAHDLQPVLQVTRMIRDNIYVTSSRTPEPERSLLLDEGFNGRTLEACKDSGDLINMNLNAEGADGVCLGFGVCVPSYQIGVPGSDSSGLDIHTYQRTLTVLQQPRCQSICCASRLRNGCHP